MPTRTRSEQSNLLDPKSGKAIGTIDRGRRTITYILQGRQGSYVPQITLHGFLRLPTGLRRNGTGFPSSGWILLREFADKWPRFSLVIDAEGPSHVTGRAPQIRVVLNHDDLRLILRDIRTTKSKQFRDLEQSIRGLLHQHFRDHFPLPSETTRYRQGSLAQLLREPDIVGRLSPQDIEALDRFFPPFFEHYSERLAKSKRLFALSERRRLTEVVFLENLVQEYERRLRAGSHNEHAWQKFLSDYILILNSSYSAILEKESVALAGKYPDFLLIDAYNYLDIYEIKRPSTHLLAYDKSRKNYYWSPEVSKAIAQVEAYIAYAERNGPALREEIHKSKGIEVRALKPRGLIIVGSRKQLQGEAMEDGFRILNRGLKNVEVVLYDELLENLKNFLARLKTGDRGSSKERGRPRKSGK